MDTFCLDERRARHAPRRANFTSILLEAFMVLGPPLSKMAKRSLVRINGAPAPRPAPAASRSR
jgi:hypothetical protein